MWQSIGLRFKQQTKTIGWIALGFVILWIYWPLFWAGPLQYDDHSNIFANPHYRDGSLLYLWKYPYYGMYIPVTSTAWSLLHSLGGDAAWPFRIFNLALHALNTVLVFFCLRGFLNRVTSRDERSIFTASFLGAAIFALHPLQMECVAWISGGAIFWRLR